MRKSKKQETIGQRILAAVLSYQLGISFERAMKLYVTGREIAPEWEEAGKALLKSAVESPCVPESLRRLGPQIVPPKGGGECA
ncbi:MAG: hypothetical protein ABSG77_04225 [Candidatus Acidiferrum sp.]|jgi:hypothetical protein